MKANTYKLAGLSCDISFEGKQENDAFLIPSFEPFRTERTDEDEPRLFSLYVEDSLRSIPKNLRERIRTADTVAGDIIIDQTADGGYQFIIKDLAGDSCCLLQADSRFSDCRCALNGNEGMRSFGLNNALMLIFAFAGSERNTVLIHASTVRNGAYAYVFTAKSGTGKSTHVAQWLSNIPGSDLLNDDNPIIRIEEGVPYVYGSPWSGKIPCFRNIRAKLGAIVKVNRADSNHVEPATTLQAFTALLGACSTAKWDPRIHDNVCKTISALIETTPNYNLFCLPDREAAIVCYKSIARPLS